MYLTLLHASVLQICLVLPASIQKKEITRCFKDIVQALKDKAAEK